ncbi:unnamed protein product [Brugia timori]|uniref:Calreticulin n=1 Tax=Brugia timori TaxID=42155 RepID=A0A3P7ST15_9BILA|nr:unnamed protein product [Brugia timori]
MYLYGDIGAVGFDLWQVKSGTIFDDVIVTDSVEEAKKFGEKTLKKTKEGEKKMKEKQDEEEEKKRKEEEEKKKEEEKEEEDKEEEEKEEDEKKKKDLSNDGDGWKKRWILSEYRNDYGKFNLSYGQFYNDPEEDLGLTTTEDVKNYAISAKFPKFSNKDKLLIVQYATKRFTLPDDDCGGLYIKV